MSARPDRRVSWSSVRMKTCTAHQSAFVSACKRTKEREREREEEKSASVRVYLCVRCTFVSDLKHTHTRARARAHARAALCNQLTAALRTRFGWYPRGGCGMGGGPGDGGAGVGGAGVGFGFGAGTGGSPGRRPVHVKKWEKKKGGGTVHSECLVTPILLLPLLLLGVTRIRNKTQDADEATGLLCGCSPFLCRGPTL